MEGDCRNPRVSLLKKYDIPIDHLSFEYIEACSDKKELERIVRILRSGEEGIYPELIKTAENQLRQIAPDSRALRVDAPILTKESISNEEWKDLVKSLLSWEEEMNVMDKTLEFEKQRFDRIGNKNLPQVRKSIKHMPGNKQNKDAEVKKIKVETNKKNERIKLGDYRAWDKFDVDKELLKIDLEDEKKEEKNSKIKRKMEKQEKQMQEKEVESINVDADSYSNIEQQMLANQAKNLGNESFKSRDYEAALKYYHVSLKLYQNAATFNNRAMTYIKMKNYEAALKDCNEVLEREPNNVKALHRRATAYRNIPGDKNNELALKDLLKIISIEPGNRVAQSDLHSLKMKLNIQDIGKKFRMMIEESGDSELQDLISKQSNLVRKSHFNTNDNLTAIRKLPLTYYGPSTSSFQCEPQSMTHRMLSGPTFSGQVMCKCNSNATRQNPLCHRCGERLSRPKQKSKPIAKPSPNQSKTEVNAFNEGLKVKSVKGNVLESKIVNASGDKKSDISISEKPKEKLGSLLIEEVIAAESEDDKSPGKSEIEGNIKKGNALRGDSVGADKGKMTDLDNAANEKSEVGKSQIGNIENENLIGSGAGGKGEIENVINDGEKDDSSGRIEVGAGSKIEEPDRNCLFFQELDLSLKENRKVSKNVKGTINETSIERRRRGESEKNDKTDKSDAMSENSLNENDNRSLPTASGKSKSKPETKKSSRSRRKKAKEPRQDGVRLRYSEPVKILQATKYLKPTSSEPKPEIDSFKESHRDGTSETKTQFSSFVPNKNVIDSESGILKSTTTSYSSNVNGKENRVSQPQCYAVNNMTRLCEGNKENIMEGGNEKNSHKGGYLRDDGPGMGSSFEFVKSWESMRKNDESYEKRAEIIRLLRPEDLKTVIGNNLDSDMLKSLLECLEKHFLNNDPKMVTSFLKELPRIPRFGMVNLFLNSNERKVLERLIESTEKNGFLLDEEVKNSLKVSF